MADVLKTYLCEAGHTPFVWGDLDCFLFVADWVERVTCIDSAGEFRGAYTSSRQARNIIKENGGPLQFSDAMLARAGCTVTDAPEVGDVALVHVAFKRWRSRVIFVPVGAICVLKDMWAIKSESSSLTIGNLPVIRAWNVPRHG